MKRWAMWVVVLASLALAARAEAGAWWHVPTGRVERDRPAALVTADGALVLNATEETYRAAGWFPLVRCEAAAPGFRVTSRTVEVGATQAVEVCTYEAVPEVEPVPVVPAQFEEGVAVFSGGHWYEFVPHDGVALAVQVSDSPIDGATRAARVAAAKAERDLLKAGLGLSRQEIQAMKQWAEADVDALFPQMTQQQRRWMKVQQRLVRFLAESEIRELREESRP